MKVGNDEFCIKCMDWLEYDDEGRCKKCRSIIQKSQKKDKKDEYSSYDRYSEPFDLDENDTEN